MTKGKLIFVSGLSGAGKTTLVGGAIEAIDNLEALLTYTTRPKRVGEEQSHEYVFVDSDEYEARKASSSNWDETIYKGNKYGSDAEKFINDLEGGINVVASVAPDIETIRTMTRIYKVKPVTIWINTDRATSAGRVGDDKLRSLRDEDEAVKQEFDIIFEPTGNVEADKECFTAQVNCILRIL